MIRGTDKKGKKEVRGSRPLFHEGGLGFSKLIFSSMKFHFLDNESLCGLHLSNYSRHLALSTTSKHRIYSSFGILPIYSQKTLGF